MVAGLAYLRNCGIMVMALIGFWLYVNRAGQALTPTNFGDSGTCPQGSRFKDTTGVADS
jgi:hypothetical protein